MNLFVANISYADSEFSNGRVDNPLFSINSLVCRFDVYVILTFRNIEVLVLEKQNKDKVYEYSNCACIGKTPNILQFPLTFICVFLFHAQSECY